MERIILDHGSPNGSLGEITPEGQAFIDALNEMEVLLRAGDPVYVEFLKGERKGSIARFIPDENPRRPDEIFNANITQKRAERWEKGEFCFRYNGSCHGICHWDGRRNKVKIFIPYGFAWLKGYDGQTVWEKFDAKAAAAAALKNPDRRDIDGNTLAIGDEVLYINSRYGSGSELDHGKVDRFEAKASTQGVEIFTIVTSRSGQESKISSPECYVWKKDIYDE